VSELLSDVVSAVLLASAAYASTNLDNLVVLGALAASSGRRRAVVGGLGIASLLLLGAALSFSLLSQVLAPRMLGWLGILPIALGLHQLIRGNDAASQSGTRDVSLRAVIVLVLANSADTLAVFGPLFAESEAIVIAVMALVFAAMVGVLSVFVRMLSLGSGRLTRFTHVSGRAVPYIMIAIGAYILFDTGTDLQ